MPRSVITASKSRCRPSLPRENASMPAWPPSAVTTSCSSSSSASRSDCAAAAGRRRSAAAAAGRGVGRARCSRTVMPVGARGKISRIVVPRPSSLSISSSPPCRCDHAEHHRQAQPRAAFAFGGEEGLEAAAARGLAHADAGVLDFDDHVARRARSTRVRNVIVPPSGNASTALSSRLVSASRSFVFGAEDLRQVGREIGVSTLHHDAAFLRHVAPARAREVDDLHERSGSRPRARA